MNLSHDSPVLQICKKIRGLAAREGDLLGVLDYFING